MNLNPYCRPTHQYQGETPICSDKSYIAKIVPRLSAPTITYALRTPGRGLSTIRVMNASHCPEMEDTSSCVWFTIASIKDDFPRVPMIIGGEEALNEDVALDNFGVLPVTCSISEAKSVAARWTPSHSSSDSSKGATEFPLTTVNADGSCLKETQVVWPMAFTLKKEPTSPRRAARCPALNQRIARDLGLDAPPYLKGLCSPVDFLEGHDDCETNNRYVPPTFLNRPSWRSTARRKLRVT